MIFRWIPIVAMTAVLSTPAFARPEGDDLNEHVAWIFSKLDANKNAYIERAEAAGSPLERDFDRVDQDGDERVSKEELFTALKNRPKKRR